MDRQYFEVVPDATPYNMHPNSTDEPVISFDSILNELSIDDYRSVFFLLMDTIGYADYLYLITKDKDYLKERFREKYNEFQFKEHMLIEILGTLQKFKLLASLNICRHVFKNEEESRFTNISPLWKCLYAVCEQLSDAQVTDLRKKLLPGSGVPITCAEQLFCLALQEHVFEKSDLKKLMDVFENFHPECYNLIASYRKKSPLRFYPIKTPTALSPCGLAVIVCQMRFSSENNLSTIRLTDRPDSRYDADALQKLWKSFGFETRVYPDLTYEGIMTLFRNLSAENLSSFDVFVTCLLSHGDKGVIFTSDCVPISIAGLIDMMANNCPSLVRKPKLFFVQACQGNKVQEGVFNYNIGIMEIPKNSIDLSCSKVCMDTPVWTDVLLVVSSIQGYPSYSPPGKLSWFIDNIVKVMNAHPDLSILSIITKVRDGVALKSGVTEDEKHKNCKQTPVTYDFLRYELKFKRLKGV